MEGLGFELLLTIQDVVPGLEVAGPFPELADEVRELQWRFRKGRAGTD
ncbi:hypothetical protein [Streptomyces sp. NPDC020607]